MKPHSMQKQAEKLVLSSHDYSRKQPRVTVEKLTFKASNLP